MTAAADGPRIAFVSPRYGRDVVGGAETLVRLFATRLAHDGVAVDVHSTCAVDHFTWRNARDAGVNMEDGVRVHRHAIGRRDQELWWNLHVAIARGDAVGYADQLAWMANGAWSPGLVDAVGDPQRYDWIIGAPYLFGTAMWACAARPERSALFPCLHDETHAWTAVVGDMLASVRGRLMNSVGEAHLAQRILAAHVGEAAAGALDCPVIGVGQAVEPVPSPDAVAAFCQAHGIEPGYLLYAGRREEGKGVVQMYHAYADLLSKWPGAPPLALMGRGDTGPGRDIAHRVIDLGFVPDAQRAAAYAGASLLIHPSSLESFGLVLMEAWMAGTPAVVTAHSDVLAGHVAACGGGMAYRDSAEFGDVVRSLLEDGAATDAAARAGRQYVIDQYAWPVVTARLLDALARWS